MFQKRPTVLAELLSRNLRVQGLESPLLQKRLVESWPVVAGAIVGRYTREVYIRNQTLYVRLTSAALRADLSMKRGEYVARLNAHVGANVVTDIRFC